MAAKIPFGSREYLHVPISLDDDAANTATLVGVTVELAILPEGGDYLAPGVIWHAATVEGDATSALARYLLTGNELRGRYDVWVRLGAPPEAPLRKAGTLTVT